MIPGPEVDFPDLSPERLRIVGDALAAARDSAQDDAQSELGDEAWSIGCTAYSRSRRAISELSGRHDWIVVLKPGMEFLFEIGIVPIRFCHDDSDRPAARHAQVGFSEGAALQRLFRFMSEAGEVPAFRCVVATNAQGYAVSVHLIRTLTDGSVVAKWAIWSPPEGEAETQNLPNPADLPPPTVKYNGDDDERERSTGTTDGI